VSDAILTLPPPPADATLPYGTDANQFGEVRVPKADSSAKKPYPVVMNIHGGFWRAKYDLKHAGHLCAALTAKGAVTWNIEYRRVGNSGGGWPGTFEDILKAWRFLPQLAKRHNFDPTRSVVMGHSAGGQLALCLAAHEKSANHAVSLAGVVDLQKGYELHLSNDAVSDFLGGKPSQVTDHYREADPMQLKIAATQWLVQGLADDVVPAYFSRNYVQTKKAAGEDAHLLEIAPADHFDLIDPKSAAWPKIEQTVLSLVS
jgi:acetyl esterase/lipase